jgi:hypothetical protein
MTQGAAKEIVEDYRDAIILDRDGTVWQFDRIDFVGLYGASVFQKLLSFLTRAKTLAVSLSARSMALSDLKSLVVECILNGRDFVNEDADQVERHRIANAVELAPNAEALFRTFQLPAPENALDQL